MLLYIDKDAVNKVVKRDKMKLITIKDVVDLEYEYKAIIQECLSILDARGLGGVEPYNSYFKGLLKPNKVLLDVPFREALDVHLTYYNDLINNIRDLRGIKSRLLK